MKNSIEKLINEEDKKNPLTDAEIAKKLNVTREQVTIYRKNNDIPDSRKRRKKDLLNIIRELMEEELSERELTKRIKEKGYNISRYSIRELKKEIEAMSDSTECNINNEHGKDDIFKNIIGAEGSLKPYVQQAKAAMLYPPKGLHSLILGSTGVGKSELASAMYNFAKKSRIIDEQAPFIVFNCADYADNPQLLIAQLFGYVKGSFTGAEKDKEGIIERANGSILFLDEVHRLPPEGQELLFYLLDKGKYRRLGETDFEREAEITIIAATTENPDSILLNTFRRRIPMVIEIPDLSERPLSERLNIIIDFFKNEASRTKSIINITNEAVKALLLYDCPGNVGQLRSDIQVSCARSFLNQVVKKDNNMRITIEELPTTAKKGLLKLKNYREKLEELTGTADFTIRPISQYKTLLIKEDLYTLPSEIYKYIENRYEILQNQYLNNEVINYIIGAEMEEKLEKLMRRVKKTIHSSDKKDLMTIVDIETLNTVEKMINSAKLMLGEDIEELFYLLAIHLKATIDRINQGKEIRNPKLNKIKKEHQKEFQIATEMLKIAEKEMRIRFTEDEAGFIALYLTMATNPENIVEEGYVGVVIITHGSVSKEMAEVANRLLGVSHAKYVEMSLDESPEIALERAIEVSKFEDEGRGVLLLVDMGSLVTFGEIITKRTGIKTRSISRVDTVMVIEAVRRTMLPNADLDEIADSLTETPKYTPRFVENKNNEYNKESNKALITICITGQGAAQKIKEFLEGILKKSKEKIKIVPIGALDENLLAVINEVRKNNEIIAAVGTVNPKIKGIKFISLERVIKGEGLNEIEKLINKEDNSMLLEIINTSNIMMDLEADSKEEILEILGGRLISNGNVSRSFIEGLYEREKIASTNLKNSIAIPHADPSHVIRPSVAIGILKKSVLWDEDEVQIVFMLALKEDNIKVVEELYELLKDKHITKKILKSEKPSDLIQIIKNAIKGGFDR